MLHLGFGVGQFAYPLTQAMWGDEGLAHTVLFDLGNSVCIYFICYSYCIWLEETEIAPKRKHIVTEILGAGEDVQISEILPESPAAGIDSYRLIEEELTPAAAASHLRRGGPLHGRRTGGLRSRSLSVPAQLNEMTSRHRSRDDGMRLLLRPGDFGWGKWVTEAGLPN